MIKAAIVTPWVGVGAKEDSNRPQLADDHVIAKWEDITGQPSAGLPLDQNIYIVLAELQPSVLDQIEADSAYFVLWSEDMPEVIE